MEYLHILINFCLEVLNYDFHIFGYTFSLMNFAIWSVLAYFLIRVIYGIFR